MKKHLHLFNTNSLQLEFYTTDNENYIEPYIGVCKETSEITANIPHYYRNDYLTFEALGTGTFTLTIPEGVYVSTVPSISYSLDNGKTWTTTQNIDDEEVVVTTPTVQAGNKVLWKSNSTQFANEDIGLYSTFSSTCNFNISGNILSLLYGYAFRLYNILPEENQVYYGGVFSNLFHSSNVVSAENLELLPIILTYSCYEMLFSGCSLLTTPPKLHGLILREYCYSCMFEDCTSLTKAPELQAINLSDFCYNSMFFGCTSLTEAPELPATTLAEDCYACMFLGCTGLTKAPKLPATTLANYCYQSMFYGCTSLTKAPELPATTLANSCYDYMFLNCSNLNYIRALFTTTPNDSYTLNWVNGVASSGAFVKASNTTWNVVGNNGVPTNWDIKDVFWEDYAYPYFKTEAIDNCLFTLSIPAYVNTDYVDYVEYSNNNGETWIKTNNTNSSVTITTPTITAGNFVLWRAKAKSHFMASENVGSNFSSTGRYNISGNIMSLIYSDIIMENFSNDSFNYKFRRLFYNSTNLISAEHLLLPATRLTNSCYEDMFLGCTRLTIAPELPATTLVYRCYSYMFYGCTSLITAPELPATTLASSCYSGMFSGCTSLTEAPELPATILAESCYTSMFSGCTSLTTAPELPATTLALYCYASMFLSCTSLTKAPLLPATTLASNCYTSMFYGCTGLTTAPELPATTLASSCYSGMFYDCTGLTEAPELPVTILSNYCYNNMFHGCTSLTEAPELPATTLTLYCYSSMFYGCTGLTEAPELPTTTLVNLCYASMFNGCTSLTEAPELPATTLANSCYASMFYGCRNLTEAPELPATILVESCYYGMFYGCTGLTTAPELPATTLISNCYNKMFYNCSNLNYIKALFITEPGTTYTNNWVYGVASSGTFVKARNATWDVTGVNGVPLNWNVDTDWDSYTGGYLTFTAIDNCQFSITIPYDISNETVDYIEYSIDNGNTWVKTINTNTLYINQNITITTPIITAGNKVLWRAEAITYHTGEDCNFSSTGRYNISGNIMSLLNGYNTFISSYSFYFSRLFSGSTNLISAENLLLPVTTLANNCYNLMFNRCTSLTKAPLLPATTLASNCYDGMFAGCTSLTEAPELPATTLAESCYLDMFNGCTSLTKAPELPATILALSCYSYMFLNCTGLTEAPELPVTTLANNCYNLMFSGCTGLTEAPELPATTLALYCYRSMFKNCTSLIKAPELPATILAESCYTSMFSGCTGLTEAPELLATTLNTYCYQYMFSGCTSLTKAPELPATTLQSYCYREMFSGCTSLIKAPKLPAITLISNCYNKMFYNCSNLNYIKALFTTTPSTSYTSNWVSGVAATGTFIKNTNATWNVTGVHGIPTGWEIELGDWDTYTNGYLTTIANENNTVFNLNIPANVSTNVLKYVEYSLDGSTWTKVQNSSLDVYITTPAINEGESILWRGGGERYAINNTASNFSSFSATKSYDVSGNIMSLLYGMTLFSGNSTYIFSSLFRDSSTLHSAKYLQLPNNVKNSCYSFMFLDCSTLIEAPTTLPATSLASNCYQNMFTRCRSLSTTPTLPATSLQSSCYQYMFSSCTGLTVTPTLSATSVPKNAYRGMFLSCTGLTTASALPATTVQTSGYRAMFYDCTNLTTGPSILPATTLQEDCYDNMFRGCTSLTEAPELPATELNTSCYLEMFKLCTNLNYLKALFTTTPNDTYTYNWVQNVSTNGTFVKNSDAEWNVVGDNGIPTNWTYITERDELSTHYLTTTMLDNNSSISFNMYAELSTTSYQNISYSLDNGETWVTKTNVDSTAVILATPKVSAGTKILWKGNGILLSTNSITRTIFAASGNFNVEGNIMSLLYGDNFVLNSSLPLAVYPLSCVFRGCSTLKSAKNLILPALDLRYGSNKNRAYYYMFSRCSGLTEAPELPATTLGFGSYWGMFMECTSLVNPPKISAVTSNAHCFKFMFQNCTALVRTPKITVTSLSDYCLRQAFENCTSLTTIDNDFTFGNIGTETCFQTFKGCSKLVNIPTITIKPTAGTSCYQMFSGCSRLVDTSTITITGVGSANTSYGTCGQMFYNCTKLQNPPIITATTTVTRCFYQMFYGCRALTSVPNLSATTLALACYSGMFYGCSNITTAPVLPALTLVTDCYTQMFYNCTKLNYIKAMFTTEPGTTYTNNWVYGVASSGTFVKNSSASWNVTGYNGILSGWTVQTASE